MIALSLFSLIFVPELFPVYKIEHFNKCQPFSVWPAKDGPKRDAYNISDNPQYRLELRAPQASAVWILLTRHITDKVIPP